MTGLKNGWPGWSSARAEALRDALDEVDQAAFVAALQRQSALQYRQFLQGIAAYRAHPYRRSVPDPAVVETFGSARLLEYAPDAAGGDETPDGDDGGPPILLIPSLINKGYILDLMEDVSLARHLAGAGVRTFLLEWNRPEGAETAFGLAGLYHERLRPALERVGARAGRPLVVGYCMGGLLALMLAQFARDRLAGLGLLATPWNFHGDRAALARALDTITKNWLPALDGLGVFPVDALQALFAANDPVVVLKKFTDFAGLPPESDDARRFVALEDWLNDGIPLPLPIARETFAGWYGRNDTAEGRWTVDGDAILPAEIDVPALAIIPDQDRIVPQDSAMALARALPNADIRIARAGHIGMMAGRRAERQTWRPLLDWRRALIEDGLV